MAKNPLGAQQVQDFGNPKIITGQARAVISGGQFVASSGATAVVGSGASTYVTSDVKFYVSDDSENVVGIALNTVASGANLSVANDGLFLTSCAGSVFAGRLVRLVASQDAIANLGSAVVPANAQDASIAGNILGRALTAGASGGFCLTHVKP